MKVNQSIVIKICIINIRNSMPIELLNQTVEFLLNFHNIKINLDATYNDKIKLLKSKNLLIQDEVYYSNDDEMSAKINLSKQDNLVIPTNYPASIETFFIDGIYSCMGAGIPSCTFPNGPKYNGTVKISSIFKCDKLTQPFVQTNLYTEILEYNNNPGSSSIMSFLPNNTMTMLSSVGTLLTGQYHLTNNYLYVNCAGYVHSLGRNTQLQLVYQKTPAGFSQLSYYLDDSNSFIIQSIIKYTNIGETLVLATTTSPYDSGLLNNILPDFESTYKVAVKLFVVGSGTSLIMGYRGDADVLLTHSPSQEDQFIAHGYGIDRQPVMYNDYVIVGPSNDPAGISGLKFARDAFIKIYETGAPFASRGDNSGTNTIEKEIWKDAGLNPVSGFNGYIILNKGMTGTLEYCNNTGSYTISNRATWNAEKSVLNNLSLLVGGQSIEENVDKSLYNLYSVIAVSPVKFPEVNYGLAKKFIDWITSITIQKEIYEYRSDTGAILFYPVEYDFSKEK